jgi:hypothetical protein
MGSFASPNFWSGKSEVGVTRGDGNYTMVRTLRAAVVIFAVESRERGRYMVLHGLPLSGTAGFVLMGRSGGRKRMGAQRTDGGGGDMLFVRRREGRENG